MSDLLHLKGELSRKALRYAEAWRAHAAKSALPGELDHAWKELTDAARAMVEPSAAPGVEE